MYGVAADKDHTRKTVGPSLSNALMRARADAIQPIIHHCRMQVQADCVILATVLRHCYSSDDVTRLPSDPDSLTSDFIPYSIKGSLTTCLVEIISFPFPHLLHVPHEISCIQLFSKTRLVPILFPIALKYFPIYIGFPAGSQTDRQQQRSYPVRTSSDPGPSSSGSLLQSSSRLAPVPVGLSSKKLVRSRAVLTSPPQVIVLVWSSVHSPPNCYHREG